MTETGAQFVPATCANGHVFYPPAIRLRGRAVYRARTPVQTGTCPECGGKGTIAAGTYAVREGKVERLAPETAVQGLRALCRLGACHARKATSQPGAGERLTR